jgi:hypothetical protein
MVHKDAQKLYEALRGEAAPRARWQRGAAATACVQEDPGCEIRRT